MKRIFSIIISVVILCCCLSSCFYNKAGDFTAKFVDNGYNNYNAGGDMAYVDGTLYINSVNRFMNKKNSVLINGKEVKSLFASNDFDSYLLPIMVMRQYYINGKHYMVRKGELLEWNDSKGDFVPTETEFNNILDCPYIDNDLQVWHDGKGICVKYKDNKKYIITMFCYEYHVSDNKIFIIDTDGWLYINDVTKGSPECYLESKLMRESTYEENISCNDYFYYGFYPGIGRQDKKGLYAYSLNDKKYRLVVEGEVKSLNAYNNAVYAAMGDGIYKVVKDNSQRISGISAEEIYILDEKWVYAMNYYGEVYRVSQDGVETEKVYP